jgi:sugar lactone lactonase YvrE
MAPQGDIGTAVECIADVNANVGEAPVWVERESALYWVDNKGKRIFRRSEDGAVEAFDTPMQVCCLVPRLKGGFIAGTDRGIVEIDLDAGIFDTIADPENDIPYNRFNDGKTDPWGRFWSGTMDNREQETTGSLYRIDPDLSLTKMDSGYKVTNGPAFDASRGRMYHTDSAAKIIYVFDLSETGDISNRGLFKQFEENDGSPDGMTVDCEGHLWVCFWDGWCLRRISPEGKVVEKVEMPVQRPTSCCFAGANLDRLYVTSARKGIDEDALAMQPCAGGLFLVETAVRGVAETSFAG